MAKGRFSDTFQISTNADTAIIAAPGNGDRIYVVFIGITVSVAGTTSRVRIENGVGGDVILRAATTAADSQVAQNYTLSGMLGYPGYALAENTALNVNTSGGAAATIDVQVIWEVK